MVSFLPQAQIRAANPLLDLAQLNQGLASVQRSNELQADRALQQQQMQSQDARQNQLIELQKRRMDMDAEQNAMANRRADAQLAIQQGEYGLKQQSAQQAAARAKAEKVARLASMVEGNQARWDEIRKAVPDINEDLPPSIAGNPVEGPRALQLMVFGPTNERDQLEMEKLRAEIDAAKNSGPFKDNKQRFDATTSLRKEFTGLNKTFRDVEAAFGRVQTAVQNAKENPGGQGVSDVALIFNYMKMLDPGSVVREGEFATAEQTAGIPARIRNLYNKMVDGGRLNDAQRNEFLNMAAGLYNREKQTYDSISQQFRGLAQQNQLDPNQVLLDFAAPQANEPDDLEKAAEDAIRRGAPREAVMQRLQQMRGQ